MNNLNSTTQPSLPDIELSSSLGTTVRSQLLWASLIPLSFFILLSILVTTSALQRITLDLVFQRDTAQVQAAAEALEKELVNQTPPSAALLQTTLLSLRAQIGSQLSIVDTQGNILSSTELPLAKQTSLSTEWTKLTQAWQPDSQIVDTLSSGDRIIVSFAPLPGTQWGLILEEPWGVGLNLVYSYQWLLVALLVLGTALSLYMLSLSIGRIIRPIAELADNAGRVVPGSTFRPMKTQGPAELRTLITAFNQMVIQLAEQQNALRQYAHKALLSQEEERQRLSHELHDGIIQDLIGLVQRIELFRGELERDPLLAHRRLDELQGLLEQTLSDVRRISNGLRPPILEDLGLPVALQSLCDDLVRQMPAIVCTCKVHGEARRLSADLELAVFRVVQEALGNIRKHAPSATRVLVELTFRESEVQATVQNDGPLFPDPDVRSLIRAGHLGLAGMYERARLFHGELEIAPVPGGGATVTLRVPCPPEFVLAAANTSV
ncbi:MAG: histidine kinase [Anaerolineales bacterium]|jgi:signal transduction histidine kinase